MIKTELISPRALKITVPEKLKAGDFRQITPQINSLIKQQGKIRSLIDASQLWRMGEYHRLRKARRVC